MNHDVWNERSRLVDRPVLHDISGGVAGNRHDSYLKWGFDMSKCIAYDETVMVDVVRDGVDITVMFCKLQPGDLVCSHGIVVEEAHQCEDSHYDGWVMYDTYGDSWFPEDFD